jgi:hypothetical protein
MLHYAAVPQNQQRPPSETQGAMKTAPKKKEDKTQLAAELAEQQATQKRCKGLAARSPEPPWPKLELRYP